MSSAENLWDSVATPLERLSLLVQLKDKVRDAAESTRPRCGSCQHWMKSRICPREKNVNGYSRGPSCNDLPCDKYLLSSRSAENTKRKCQEAVDSAEAHGLPTPTQLLVAPENDHG